MTTMLDTALHYAQTYGWAVHPVNIKKVPTTEHGRDDATHDEATIREYFKNGAQLAVATGPESNVFVFDVDVDEEKGLNGFETLEYLEGRYGKLPHTPHQRTGRGGMQYFFNYIPGLKNSAGKIGAGIDTRGDGGYAVVAPSRNTRGPYEWIVSPADAPLADPPQWIIDLLQREDEPAESTGGVAGDHERYVSAALAAEIGAIATAPAGRRNDTLNRAAYNLGQIVGAGLLARDQVEQLLRGAAGLTGLKTREIEATIKSGIEAGMKKPRTIPDRKPAEQGSKQATQEPPRPAQNENCTDLGNARRFVRQHGDNVRYVEKWGCWFIWDGRCWVKDETGAIHRLARQTVMSIYAEAADAAAAGDESRKGLAGWAKNSESRARLESMVKLVEAEDGIYVHHEQLDAQPWLLNVWNGTIDLRTGELLPHNRDHLLTKCLDVDYDPGARSPTWCKFIDRVMGGDQDLAAFVQRAVGYSLTGDTSEQCLFFLYGSGKNGKSTFTETLMTLLSDYAQKAPTDMLMMRQNGGAIPNDVARLPGARFVVAAEIEEGRRLAESMIKDLTGGDRLIARFMRQEFFEFTPTHKLWVYGNHKPVIRGTDEGIWRRIRMVPFTVIIPPEERDPHLKNKLRAELAGILTWAVQGCLDWQSGGLTAPAAVAQATTAYRVEMDVIGAFIDDCCITGSSVAAPAGALYAAYQAWCKEGSEYAVNQRRFGMQLAERGFERFRSNGQWRWRGLGLMMSAPGGGEPDDSDPSVPHSDPSDPISGITGTFKNSHERSEKLDHYGSLGSLPEPGEQSPPPSATSSEERQYAVMDVLTDPVTYEVVSWTASEGERTEFASATVEAAESALAVLTASRLDWSYVEGRYRAGDAIALQRHAAIHRVPYDVLREICAQRWP